MKLFANPDHPLVTLKQQRQRISELSADLDNLCLQPQVTYLELATQLLNMTNAIREHLQDEEHWLSTYDPPTYPPHCTAHQHFRQQLDALQTEFLTTPRDQCHVLSRRLLELVVELENHWQEDHPQILNALHPPQSD